ncbi:acyl carrier protein [Clostridium sp. 'deep sea']|uniref:acyl carrier protein n=1 Tax=Clostridium sp. 'deep sea' TaxID=2779445 RepID=UPI00189668C6|nr:acyl carrier protein [Clostridium sp. 'deep sea']QOR35247.1 acyl carrier protein [Clostridium sp. 'deep sea']
MNKIIEILSEIIPGENFETANNLVDGKILTSANIIRLVASLNEQFDIEITPLYLVPENFNSVESIFNLVTLLDEE